MTDTAAPKKGKAPINPVEEEEDTEEPFDITSLYPPRKATPEPFRTVRFRQLLVQTLAEHLQFGPLDHSYIPGTMVPAELSKLRTQALEAMKAACEEWEHETWMEKDVFKGSRLGIFEECKRLKKAHKDITGPVDSSNSQEKRMSKRMYAEIRAAENCAGVMRHHVYQKQEVAQDAQDELPSEWDPEFDVLWNTLFDYWAEQRRLEVAKPTS
ncbi:hypothetical protein BT63DRAFT_34278 [Microthyrium microscopicum]|uniref:Uncharacterized protein n=1 Tax=Microthyrium microscopicum TaxID=703497 RepID=A0A6A6UWF9_9PEZI|nr:hypothetical protein BT63DRAFT_34278 [Microthyrium microscopicum]